MSTKLTEIIQHGLQKLRKGKLMSNRTLHTKRMEEYVKQGHGSLLPEEIDTVTPEEAEAYLTKRRNRPGTMRAAENRRKPMRLTILLEDLKGRKVCIKSKQVSGRDFSKLAALCAKLEYDWITDEKDAQSFVVDDVSTADEQILLRAALCGHAVMSWPCFDSLGAAGACLVYKPYLSTPKLWHVT